MADGCTHINETAGARLRRLEAEVRADALREKDSLISDLVIIAGRCADLATVQCLPPGVANALEKLGASLESDLQNLQSISVRTA